MTKILINIILCLSAFLLVQGKGSKRRMVKGRNLSYKSKAQSGQSTELSANDSTSMTMKTTKVVKMHKSGSSSVLDSSGETYYASAEGKTTKTAKSNEQDGSKVSKASSDSKGSKTAKAKKYKTGQVPSLSPAPSYEKVGKSCKSQKGNKVMYKKVKTMKMFKSSSSAETDYNEDQ